MSKKEKIKTLKKAVKDLRSKVKKLKLAAASARKPHAAKPPAGKPETSPSPSAAKLPKPAEPAREPKTLSPRIAG